MSAKWLLASLVGEGGDGAEALITKERPMSMIQLATPTMLFVSAAWLDPARERPLLDGWARGRLSLAQVEGAHDALASFVQADAETERAARSLSEACAEANAEHDRKARAVWYGLTAAAEDVDDPAQGERLLAERDRLMPSGLDVTRWSWADEVGESVRVIGRRTPAGDALLRGVSLTPGRTLFDTLERWVAAAQRLGELDRERARVRPKRSGPSQHALRSAWVKVARRLESDAVYDALPDAEQERLFGRLRRAIQQARAKAEKATDKKPAPE